MRVVYYHRKPDRTTFSVEEHFKLVREYLPSNIEPIVATCRFSSRGVLRRGYNTVEARFREGDINHITGDVHYLTYLTAKARTILTMLDCGTLHRLSGFRQEVFRQLWYAIPARRVAAITAISEATKADILRFVACDPDLITVIPVFVSPEFIPKQKDFDAFCPRVLQVGTAPNKNIERVAQALSGIKCKLEIVGQPSSQQIAELDRFAIDYRCYPGLSNAQLRAKYEACDVVMFASTFEGFGMPIVEGNSIGRVVVTGNVASMPEVAADAACLVDPWDPASIRAGLLRVVNDAGYRHHLVDRGFENRRRFSPAAVARAYADLYERVANAAELA